jgi:arginyl-tRNA synthetase
LALQQANDPRLGCIAAADPLTIVLDFGGPNVAKEMHVGHLRCAITGECLQRIAQFLGHKTISDVHLGDWGLPYGKTILELKIQQPDLPYFNPNHQGEFPESAPVTLEELNKLYREGNERCKNDEEALAEAREITALMQKGDVGYHGLWRHFVQVSVNAIRANYKRMDIHFDYWYGESDAYAYIEKVEHILRSKNILVESEGAQVIEVAQESDGENQLPPLLFYKGNGAVTYGSTDLATIYQRRVDFAPDEIWYVVDQRQGMHFKQVFRAAEKAGFLKPAGKKVTPIQPIHIGYGTINGPDGKPMKTRDGQQIYLGAMLDEVYEAAKALLPTADSAECLADQFSQEALDQLATDVAMAAIKFNDMKNNTATDYSFDIQQCTRFEGKTGPYLQYAVARINSVIKKASENSVITPNLTGSAIKISNEFERKLIFTLLQFSDTIQKAFDKHEPSIICDHAYEVAQAFSRFYTECPILKESLEVQAQRVKLVELTRNVLQQELHLLGIKTPEKIYTQRSES